MLGSRSHHPLRCGPFRSAWGDSASDSDLEVKSSKGEPIFGLMDLSLLESLEAEQMSPGSNIQCSSNGVSLPKQPAGKPCQVLDCPQEDRGVRPLEVVIEELSMWICEKDS